MIDSVEGITHFFLVADTQDPQVLRLVLALSNGRHMGTAMRIPVPFVVAGAARFTPNAGGAS